jgi:hypothetical protein
MRHTRRRDVTDEVEYCYSLVMTVMEITGICDPNISVYSGFRLINGDYRNVAGIASSG